MPLMTSPGVERMGYVMISAISVTFSNSAVDNFSQRISSRLKEAGLLPGMGYRVRTLHGLAHDIIKERPDLAGLNNDFAIIDERETQMILANIAQTYFNLHKDDFVSLLKEDLGEYYGEV